MKLKKIFTHIGNNLKIKNYEKIKDTIFRFLA